MKDYYHNLSSQRVSPKSSVAASGHKNTTLKFESPKSNPLNLDLKMMTKMFTTQSLERVVMSQPTEQVETISPTNEAQVLFEKMKQLFVREGEIEALRMKLGDDWLREEELSFRSGQETDQASEAPQSGMKVGEGTIPAPDEAEHGAASNADESSSTDSGDLVEAPDMSASVADSEAVSVVPQSELAMEVMSASSSEDEQEDQSAAAVSVISGSSSDEEDEPKDSVVDRIGDAVDANAESIFSV